MCHEYFSQSKRQCALLLYGLAERWEFETVFMGRIPAISVVSHCLKMCSYCWNAKASTTWIT